MTGAIVRTYVTCRRKSILTGIGAVAPVLVVSLLPLLTGVARAQAQEQVSAASATIDSTIEAAESDAPRPPYDQKLINWNDYKGESTRSISDTTPCTTSSGTTRTRAASPSGAI